MEWVFLGGIAVPVLVFVVYRVLQKQGRLAPPGWPGSGPR